MIIFGWTFDEDEKLFDFPLLWANELNDEAAEKIEWI